MPNRLGDEASLYLRQHADQPVDWYPWGPAAVAAARGGDRPVLLSVGYAACHWCHVMAHESFADPDVAGVLNRAFVAVKVDRDERPDVDALYQGLCQAVTGQGGWPLTVFLTPELHPFYIGTYFPPQPRWGRPAFVQVAAALAQAWRERRGELEAVAAEWTRAMTRVATASPPAAAAPPDLDVVDAGQALLLDADREHGGFGAAPKFPSCESLDVLLRAGGEAVDHAVFTLRAMAAGGMRDAVGGGFHRYSVDAQWRVPHFEKMLYDNALLPMAYLAAWQRCGDDALAEVAADTLDYLMARLQGPDGGFFSSEDADSLDGSGSLAEGAYYTWTRAEVESACGDAATAREVAALLGIGAADLESGRSVPQLRGSPGPDWPRQRALLAAFRARRPPPAVDDKVLTGWNGLAISALARGGRMLARPAYVAAAMRAAELLIRVARRPDGGLWRRYRRGAAGVAATLEDYAYLGSGLLDLYEATFDTRQLAAAFDLAHQAVARFADPGGEGFFLTEAVDPGDPSGVALPTRPRDTGDGGTPSPQGVLVQVLLRLQPYVDDRRFAQTAAAVLRRYAPVARRQPRGLSTLLCALDLQRRGPVEVVLAGDLGDARLQGWLDRLRRLPIPNLVLSRVDPGGVPGLAAEPPLWRGRRAIGGRPTLWVCRDGTCLPPTHRFEDVAAALGAADAGG